MIDFLHAFSFGAFYNNVLVANPVLPLVGKVPDKHRGHPVRDLPDEEDDPREGVVKVDDLAEEEEEVGEPHGGAEVVEDVAEGVGELLQEAETRMRRLRGIFHRCVETWGNEVFNVGTLLKDCL